MESVTCLWSNSKIVTWFIVESQGSHNCIERKRCGARNQMKKIHLWIMFFIEVFSGYLLVPETGMKLSKPIIFFRELICWKKKLKPKENKSFNYSEMKTASGPPVLHEQESCCESFRSPKIPHLQQSLQLWSRRKINKKETSRMWSPESQRTERIDF